MTDGEEKGTEGERERGGKEGERLSSRARPGERESPFSPRRLARLGEFGIHEERGKAEAHAALILSLKKELQANKDGGWEAEGSKEVFGSKRSPTLSTVTKERKICKKASLLSPSLRLPLSLFASGLLHNQLNLGCPESL